MYNKNNLAVAKVASRSRIRPALASVAFYGDRTVATDSFRLIEMSATGKKKIKPALYGAKEVLKIKLKKGETMDEPSTLAQSAKGDEYPLIEHIFERASKQKYASVKVNAAYLEEICAVLKGLDPFQAITLQLPVESAYEPVIIEAVSGLPVGDEPRQRARALLMPMNK